jgi:hypothetical protein
MLFKRIIFILSILLVSCANIKTVKPIEKQIKVFVGFFENQSSKTKINEIVTDSLTDMLIDSNMFDFTTKENADYLVRGTILSYSQSAQIYDYEDKIRMYKIRVNIKINIFNNKTLELLNNFNVSATTIYSDNNISAETEDEAIQRIKFQAAMKIYKELKKYFYE